MQNSLRKLLTVIALVAAMLQTDSSEAAAEEAIQLNVVSLGDSFIAGNGTGADQAYGPSECYRTDLNYAALFADAYRATRTVGYTNMACSGATVADLIDAQLYAGLDVVNEADIVFVSIGGNDAEFDSIVVECMFASAVFGTSCKRRIDELWLNNDGLVRRIADAVREVADQMKPGAHAVLVGYPKLLGDCDRTIKIESAITGELVNYNVSFELRNLQEYLNSKTAEVLHGEYRNGVSIAFVSVQDLYDEHEVCGAQTPWLHSLLDTVTPKDWLHPTRDGHSAVSQLLLQQSFALDANVVGGGSDSSDTYVPDGVKYYRRLPFDCTVTDAYLLRNDSSQLGLTFVVVQDTILVAPYGGRIYHGLDSAGVPYVELHRGRGGYVHTFFGVTIQSDLEDGQRVRRGAVIGSSSEPAGVRYTRSSIVVGEMPIDLRGPEPDWMLQEASLNTWVSSHAVAGRGCAR